MGTGCKYGGVADIGCGADWAEEGEFFRVLWEFGVANWC